MLIERRGHISGGVEVVLTAKQRPTLLSLGDPNQESENPLGFTTLLI
jgi:hypothetical protein